MHICNLLVKKIASVKEIAQMYDVSEGCITAIKRKDNWSFISQWFEFE